MISHEVKSSLLSLSLSQSWMMSFKLLENDIRVPLCKVLIWNRQLSIVLTQLAK